MRAFLLPPFPYQIRKHGHLIAPRPDSTSPNCGYFLDTPEVLEAARQREARERAAVLAAAKHRDAHWQADAAGGADSESESTGAPPAERMWSVQVVLCEGFTRQWGISNVYCPGPCGGTDACGAGGARS